MSDATNSANDWLIADPSRLEAWRGIATACLQVADAFGSTDLVAVATWLLAMQLRVRYTVPSGEAAPAAEVDWYSVAEAIYGGMPTTEDEGAN